MVAILDLQNPSLIPTPLVAHSTLPNLPLLLKPKMAAIEPAQNNMICIAGYLAPGGFNHAELVKVERRDKGLPVAFQPSPTR